MFCVFFFNAKGEFSGTNSRIKKGAPKRVIEVLRAIGFAFTSFHLSFKQSYYTKFILTRLEQNSN